MAVGGIKCNSCGKTVWDEEEANGWFQVHTLLTRQPFVQVTDPMAMFDPARKAEIEAEIKSQLPPALGGEFCSVKCLTQYVNTHEFLEQLEEVVESTTGKAQVVGEGQEQGKSEGRAQPTQGTPPPPVRPAVGQDSGEQTPPSAAPSPEVQRPGGPESPDIFDCSCQFIPGVGIVVGSDPHCPIHQRKLPGLE